jgi:hypothetical protein
MAQIRIDMGSIRRRQRARRVRAVLHQGRLTLAAVAPALLLAALATVVVRALGPAPDDEPASWVAPAAALLFGAANFGAQALRPALLHRVIGGEAAPQLRIAGAVAACLPGPAAFLLSLDRLMPCLQGELMWLIQPLCMAVGAWLGWRVGQAFEPPPPPPRPVLRIGSRDTENGAAEPATVRRQGGLTVSTHGARCGACFGPIAAGQPTARCTGHPSHTVHRQCVAMAGNKCPLCKRPIV